MGSSGKETAPLFSGTDITWVHSYPSLKSERQGRRRQEKRGNQKKTVGKAWRGGKKGNSGEGEEDGRREAVGKKGKERKRREEEGGKGIGE